MKKIGIFIGLACVVAAGAYFMVTARLAKVTGADFLPTEVLFTLEQRELGPLLDDFKVSRLGRAVSGLDLVKIATDLGRTPEEIEQVRDGKKQFEDSLNSPIFREFFGQEFTIGVLPVADFALVAPEKSVRSSLLLIAKPQHNTDILELITKLFAKKMEQTSLQHGKYSLKQYLIEEGVTLTVAIVDSFVIAALDEHVVKASLDRYDSKQGSLSQNQEYIRLRKEFVDAKLFAYASMPVISKQTSQLTATLDPAQKEGLQQAVEQWQGWEGMAFGAWKEKGMLRDKGMVLFKKDKLTPLVAKMCSVKPVENKTLAMIPANILGYYWSNTLNMSAFWEMFTQEMKDDAEQLAAMEKSVKSSTGFELQEIFAMFGSEAVFVLKDIAAEGFIPLPNGAIFLQLAQEEKFITMVEALLAKVEIPIQTEEYKGVKLKSLGMSLHPSLQPVYGVYQGYLIVADTVDLVKKIIDNKDGGSANTLIGEAGFQQINQGLNQGLTQANNSVSYVKFSALLKMMKELANWGGTMLAMQDPETAQQAKILIDQLIHPLFDGLAMYEVVGSRSVIKDDAIILESSTTLAQ
jgi:hypothetical protein